MNNISVSILSRCFISDFYFVWTRAVQSRLKSYIIFCTFSTHNTHETRTFLRGTHCLSKSHCVYYLMPLISFMFRSLSLTFEIFFCSSLCCFLPTTQRPASREWIFLLPLPLSATLLCCLLSNYIHIEQQKKREMKIKGKHKQQSKWLLLSNFYCFHSSSTTFCVLNCEIE